MSGHMNDNLVIAVLQQVFTYSQSNTGLIHHSDCGSQHKNKDFRDPLTQQCLITNMSGADNCHDNNAVIKNLYTKC